MIASLLVASRPNAEEAAPGSFSQGVCDGWAETDRPPECVQVPKMLGVLRDRWAPRSFVVSFKLETDPGLLVSKASGAIDKYGVHAVVANLLHDRKDRVLVLQGPHIEEARIERGEDPDIELKLCAHLARRHESFMQESV